MSAASGLDALLGASDAAIQPFEEDLRIAYQRASRVSPAEIDG